MSRWTRRANTAQCVVPETDAKGRTDKPSKKAFVVVIALIVMTMSAITEAGMPVTTSVEVVAAGLTAVEAARRLTAAKASAPTSGTAH